MPNVAARNANGIGLLRRIANAVPDPLRPLARWFWVRLNVLKARLRRLPGSGRPHELPGDLVISLTSYPPRFGTLHLTLRCLLSQSVKADRVILWIAHEDMDLLPSSATGLRDRGLEIRSCDDLRSYKKLVPAVEAFPEAYIVTADDDLYYPSNWLKLLVEEVDPNRPVIVGRRAVRLIRDDAGQLAPFKSWERDVADARARQPSPDLMCETGAGALFPPNCLHPIATDHDKFNALAPDGDDLWFYWCARMARTLVKKAGNSLIIVPWPGTEEVSLWSANEWGGNDEKVGALVSAFGTFDQAEAS